ncbi:copper-translocating P-type ATPase [Candidatus Wolfebacteria bacterium]|nr:copper-translocating P-type ATPase [Candidatus Wolfebacteria bacterium]
MKQTYKISGIHCASCVLTIETTLKKLNGVKSAAVNFANETALIEFDENLISEKDLAKAVENIGYVLEIFPDSSAMDQMPEHTKMANGEHDHHKMSPEDHAAHLEAESILILKKKLWLGGILSILIFIGSFPGLFQFLPKSLLEYLANNFTLLLLATPVQFWVGWQFYSGLKMLFKYRTADMNTLIAIGTLAAYFYSIFIVLSPQNLNLQKNLYFDTSSIIITLVLLGRYFEALMKRRASDAIKKLIALAPKTAKVIRDNKEIEIRIEEMKINEIIIVKPGEKIPVDGIIIEGSSEIDESMITGESMPIHKEKNANVIAGTINKFGSFTFKATKIGKDTVLARIIKLVELAQGSKAPIQRLADLISSYFVPAVIAVAALTFITWYSFDNFQMALMNMIGVLIIACPCALGLATPIAIMVSTGNAAKKGILVKDAESLEIGRKVDTIVFDKTGTLTKGKPALVDIINLTNENILQIAGSLETKSEHPLARAILEEAKKQSIEFLEVKNFQAIGGKGTIGEINGKKILIGTEALIAESDIKISESIKNQKDALESQGKTAMLLAIGNEIAGIFAVADSLKPEAKKTIESLKKMRLEVWMITGDNEKTARAIADEIGIENIMSRVLPENKVNKIKELQEKGKILAMVGDGINDAPALAQADLSIAMGEGSDIAMESASITLMRGDLALVPEIISLSQKTIRNIKQNLFWAFFYNIAFIPVAAGALYPFFGILLNPIFAGAAMALSSISVVMNSLRLKR